MSRILVVYATTHGQTRKVAHALADALTFQGHRVDVIDATSTATRPDQYDGVIVAASVQAGGYQKTAKRWVRLHAQALAQRPTAFVSVCLAVLQKDPKVQREMAAIMQRFFEATSWQPTLTKPVAGALRYTKYNLFLRWTMKRIVAKAGGDTDTSRDYEYTDWNDLRSFAESFAELMESAVKEAV